MNKFKVGDKVGNQHVNYLGEIIEVINVELSKVRVYDGVISVYMNEALVKTPHQELLDLGWEMVADNDQEITYQLFDDHSTFTYQLKIDKLRKFIDNRYCVFGKYTNITVIDLQLAKILVRYLEELE